MRRDASPASGAILDAGCTLVLTIQTWRFRLIGVGIGNFIGVAPGIGPVSGGRAACDSHRAG